MKIVEVFSPNHFVIAQLFENFGIFIIDLIIHGADSLENLTIKIIMFILLILTSFIYNEILIINICGLSKNTKLFLDYEEKVDISLSGLNANDKERNTEFIELSDYLLKKEDDQTEND